MVGLVRDNRYDGLNGYGRPLETKPQIPMCVKHGAVGWESNGESARRFVKCRVILSVLIPIVIAAKSLSIY